MGLLELFGKKKSGAGAIKKHAGRVANKRAQAADRWESIQALGAMGTPEAVEALIGRFSIRVDPSITDHEEKDATVEAIVKAGEGAVEPLRAFLKRADSIAWPTKCLERLLDDESIVGELLAVLQDMDTEYERDPEKKLQILSALEERQDARIIPAVQRFLEDVNEAARFHAAATLFAQQSDGAPDEGVREALLDAFVREESVRTRARILDGFIDCGWDLGGRREEVKGKLPAGYVLDAKGQARRSR